MRSRPLRPAVIGSGGFLLLLDCGSDLPPDTARPPLELVVADRWRPRDPDLDPLGHRVPRHVPCRSGDIRPEDDTLEINTQNCSFALVTQPSLGPVRRGDTLELELWWQLLISAHAATAHLAVLFETQVLWEEAVRVPGPADRRVITLKAPASYPVRSEIIFHLHNHGYNHYRLGGLRRR